MVTFYLYYTCVYKKNVAKHHSCSVSVIILPYECNCSTYYYKPTFMIFYPNELTKV